MKKLSNKMEKIFKDFKPDKYYLSVLIDNDDEESWDLVNQADTKFIIKELLNHDVATITDTHNHVIDKMLKAQTKGDRKEFFKLLKIADALWIEVDIKLDMANSIIKSSVAA